MNLSMYSRSLLFSIMFFVCSIQLAQAQDYEGSFGGRLGTYTAVSLSIYTAEGRSFEALLGLTRVANQSDFLIGSFYKFHFDVTSELPTLKWYSGLGLIASFEEELGHNKVKFSPSAIVGMEYTLEHTPVNFFIDVSPNYKINSESKFRVHANLGVRYIFSYFRSGQ